MRILPVVFEVALACLVIYALFRALQVWSKNRLAEIADLRTRVGDWEDIRLMQDSMIVRLYLPPEEVMFWKFWTPISGFEPKELKGQ